jgi:rubrerythrin
MATLKSTPPVVESAEELMALAYAMEEEAARRYRELAARMRLRRESRLAALFDFFADVEDKHATQIGDHSLATGGPSRDAGRIRWEVPENFDEEAGSSRLLTPYRALAVAVRNEERAFRFYSYVAAGAPDDRTRKIAEELAKDELGHAWLLRRERRKAYREEISSGEPRPNVALPASLAELQITIAETEWRAAQYHRRVAEALQRQDPEAAALFAEAAKDEEACARGAMGPPGGSSPSLAADIPPTAAGGLRLFEEAFERYMDIAARSRDEAIMRQAQLQAEQAVRHLGLVRGNGNKRSRA